MPHMERREYFRIHSLNLSYICLDEKSTIVKQGMGRTLNLSPKGVLLETSFNIDKRFIIVLSIGLEEDIVEIKGRVIYSNQSSDTLFETGITFFDMDTETETMLTNFIQLHLPEDMPDYTPENMPKNIIE
jgi:hypothetical protein